MAINLEQILNKDKVGQYQKRIDLLLLSPETFDLLEDCGIHKKLRGLERPSDHTPAWIKIKN